VVGSVLAKDVVVPAPRLLIADDDREMRRVLRDMLRPTGADIREAANGQDLLGHLETGEYDLIITDLRMPAPNGLQVMMKARSAGCQTPFILITAFGDEEIRAELGRIPNAFMLEKPFARPALLSWVATALRDREPASP
jgi:CheY-like chemotaxis protein